MLGAPRRRTTTFTSWNDCSLGPLWLGGKWRRSQFFFWTSTEFWSSHSAAEIGKGLLKSLLLPTGYYWTKNSSSNLLLLLLTIAYCCNCAHTPCRAVCLCMYLCAYSWLHNDLAHVALPVRLSHAWWCCDFNPAAVQLYGKDEEDAIQKRVFRWFLFVTFL